jgi:hypothetical protein
MQLQSLRVSRAEHVSELFGVHSEQCWYLHMFSRVEQCWYCHMFSRIEQCWYLHMFSCIEAFACVFMCMHMPKT